MHSVFQNIYKKSYMSSKFINDIEISGKNGKINGAILYSMNNANINSRFSFAQYCPCSKHTLASFSDGMSCCFIF